MSTRLPAAAPPRQLIYLIPTLTPLTLTLLSYLLSTGHSATLLLSPSQFLHPPPELLPISHPSSSSTSHPNLLLLPHDPSTPSSSLSSAIAHHLARFSRLDVLVLTRPPSTTPITHLTALTLPEITAAFTDTIHSATGLLQSVLPIMRRQRMGHVIAVVSAMATGGVGAGMGLTEAADAALEGVLEGVGYEIAGWGGRITVVGAGEGVVGMPFAGGQESRRRKPRREGDRGGGGGVRLDVTGGGLEEEESEVVKRMRRLQEGLRERGGDVEAMEEVVRVIGEIAGKTNPPGRITVGIEEREAVRERLRLVSEEMEEFLEASLGVD